MHRALSRMLLRLLPATALAGLAGLAGLGMAPALGQPAQPSAHGQQADAAETPTARDSPSAAVPESFRPPTQQPALGRGAYTTGSSTPEHPTVQEASVLTPGSAAAAAAASAAPGNETTPVEAAAARKKSAAVVKERNEQIRQRRSQSGGVLD